MKKLLLLLLLIPLSLVSQNLDTFFDKTNTFVSENVKNGKVDYNNIKSNISSLDEIIELSNTINSSDLNPSQYKAFWINIYNLSVIKGITNNLKINSPLDVAGFFDKKLHKVGGKSITLNDIENKLLREKFNDPRLHFVLVCGAIGCPVLINEAYTPNKIEEQLNAQTKLAINNPNFIKINRKKKRVAVSEILKWYKQDFVQNGTEIDFLNGYLDNPITSKFKLSYYSYNWNLNIIK